MFTGIIEEVGTVRAIRRGSTESKIIVACRKVLGRGGSLSGGIPEAPTAIGDSIAVNGVCLTVTAMDSSTFTADVIPETFSRSALSVIRPGSPVNLERALPVYGRFGGHIVSGHIDGTGTIRSRKRDGNAEWFTIDADDALVRQIVEKGSIAIDGISLTVATVDHTRGKSCFQVSIIPHTLAETALHSKKSGDPINLETDVIGKYVAQQLKYKEDAK